MFSCECKNTYFEKYLQMTAPANSKIRKLEIYLHMILVCFQLSC